VEDAGCVLALHAFSNDIDSYPEDWGEEEGIGGALSLMAMSMAEHQYPVALLISAGILQRHPKLDFVLVECGAGWLAWLLYALDEQMAKKHMWIRPKLEMMPSEFFAR
jgi:predicted TIM-barrel fold metal-dependent hydrolase